MDWLLEFIARIPGPQFVIVYGLLTVVALAVCRWWVRHRDPTKSLPAVQVPSNPDPYEIAYLRGGENEVLRVVLFRLLQQGVLRVLLEKGALIEKETFITGSTDAGLRPMEQEIAHRSASHTSKEVFRDVWIKHRVAAECSLYRDRLQAERLLVRPEDKARYSWIATIGTLLILGIGAYKLIAALANGHSNVAFLIIIGLVGVGILWQICTTRLTFRGREYLQRLEAAFGQWKAQASELGESQLLLLMSVFGAAVLSGTAYDYFRQMFSKGNGNCGSCGGCDGGCGGCGD